MHLVIPDCQIREGIPLRHLDAIANLTIDKQPEVIINLGDWWDLPSLSSYDMGTIHSEGQRLSNDIKAGNEAMERLLGPIKAFREKQILSHRKIYQPRMHFCIGNHEERLIRYIRDNPHLDETLGYQQLNLGYWVVHDFLKPIVIDGISYAHYFVNPMSGRPYGGSIVNVVNKLGFSFTQGHAQKLDFYRKDLNNGKVIQGLIAGACYLHDERYKGYQGNHHWRGVILKHNVQDGEYDIEVLGMDRLLEAYA